MDRRTHPPGTQRPAADGTVELHDLSAEERQALSLLPARPLTTATATIRLPDLDTRLRSNALAQGLAEALDELGPLFTDRRAARDAAAAQRAGLWSAAEAASPRPP
ncbi:TIGR02679 domain-containing protein [Streptomyces sp. NPDC048419]|uniref:TIGR02679 domain-containing protein n=1 Tax=Streptomyces sp. NPDC048419 TaxID=3365547 RepID=UPI003711ABBF